MMHRKFYLLALLLLSGAAFAVPQTDVVGYWGHELQPGYNLVAFPVLPQTATVQAVIGDRIGEVEVTTWDPALRDYRWARFDPQSGAWRGNLYILARGEAYWINILGNDPQRLIVTGHPEIYTRFRWDQLQQGWSFYAPTYGKAQSLRDLPPERADDMLVSWNASAKRFDLAEASAEKLWESAEFEQFAPDRAYAAYLSDRRNLRPVGPPLPIEALYDQAGQPAERLERDAADDGNFARPPRPLIVGNRNGLAVCRPDGRPCDGTMTVYAVREFLRIGEDGGFEPVNERLSQHRVVINQNDGGKFRIALAVGEGEGVFHTGERVHLLVRDGLGGEARSTSFEIPENVEQIVDDVAFNDPLRAHEEGPDLPRVFALGQPYPNPFNDRFTVEVRLPESKPVEIVLFDIAGRKAYTMELPLGAGIHRVTVPAGSLSAGVYLMQVAAGDAKGLAKVAHLK